MTIAGIPKVLENAILSVLESHNVSNWSIFGEINGSVSIKIRFNVKGEGQDSSSVQNISYKRKSDKQLNRDRLRARKRKRVISSEAENSLERERQCETSSNQDFVFDNQFSPCVDLPPVNEIQHEQNHLDFENLQNIIEATLSDTETSLNSTACATDTILEIPDDENLFLDSKDPEAVIPAPDPSDKNLSLFNEDRETANPVLDRDWKNRIRKDLQDNDRAWFRHLSRSTPLARKLYPINQ